MTDPITIVFPIAGTGVRSGFKFRPFLELGGGMSGGMLGGTGGQVGGGGRGEDVGQAARGGGGHRLDSPLAGLGAFGDQCVVVGDVDVAADDGGVVGQDGEPALEWLVGECVELGRLGNPVRRLRIWVLAGWRGTSALSTRARD